MSQLLDFYRGQGRDSEGRLLGELWGWKDDALESVHDFIQWLFPLPEPSQFNARAPLLSAADIAAFRADDRLRGNLQKSFERFLSFLGLRRTADGKVLEGENFSARAPEVWDTPNHNWLRITRLLRSLTLLGLEGEAQALYDRLEALAQSRKCSIPANTFGHWTRAVKRSVPRG
jgi:hypothetical protein